ncbi:MAG: hypothetical protein ACM3O9_01575 [Methylocystaceae bacterium]
MQPIGIIEFNREERAVRHWNWLKRWPEKPRINSLFAIEDEGPLCCRLLLPSSLSEWSSQEVSKRAALVQTAGEQLDSFEVGALAWPWFNGLPGIREWKRPLFTGWYFTAALALILARERLASDQVRRLYVAGHTPCIPEIIDLLSHWHCPVLWSSPVPAQCEAILHQLYYERGCRAAVTAFRPMTWEPGDLVLSFNQPLAKLALASRAQVIDLSPEAYGFFPYLEQNLIAQGVDRRLGYLGPLMEAFVNQGRVLSQNPQDSIIKTLAGGAAYGCWELILDNELSAHYNSLKGLAGYLG